jgi:hypothetical protein
VPRFSNKKEQIIFKLQHHIPIPIVLSKKSGRKSRGALKPLIREISKILFENIRFWISEVLGRFLMEVKKLMSGFPLYPGLITIYSNSAEVFSKTCSNLSGVAIRDTNNKISLALNGPI